VICSGGFGFSAGAGLLGCEEHPAINPAARIATNILLIIFSFTIDIIDFLIRFSVRESLY
jgi:hypothetical protein